MSARETAYQLCEISDISAHHSTLAVWCGPTIPRECDSDTSDVSFCCQMSVDLPNGLIASLDFSFLYLFLLFVAATVHAAGLC